MAMAFMGPAIMNAHGWLSGWEYTFVIPALVGLVLALAWHCTVTTAA